MKHLKLFMQNKEYKMTKYGYKVFLDGKPVCRECDERIKSKDFSPWCKFCERVMNKKILEEFESGVPVTMLKLRYKVGYGYFRLILGERLNNKYKRQKTKVYHKPKIVETAKSYQEILQEKTKPVKDSLSFLKSKIRI